jgi:hypothetical protein
MEAAMMGVISITVIALSILVWTAMLVYEAGAEF